MKRSLSALARVIILILPALALSGSAQAASYRCVVVKFDPKDTAIVENASEDHAALFQLATKGIVKIAEFVTIECGSNGVGSIDQTYGIRHAQSVDEANRPKKFTTRKVGTEASVREIGTALEIRFSKTEFLGWITVGSRTRFDNLQPLFSTDNFSSTIVTPKAGELLLLRGLTTEKTTPNKDLAPIKTLVRTMFFFQKLPDPVP